MDDAGPRQAMLAEYTALRAEVERRAGIQWNVFALQVTAAGAVAGLTLSAASGFALLLVVPLSSYMFGARYILHDFHIKLIGRYLSESLAARLDGALQWDSWKAAESGDGKRQRLGAVVGWSVMHPTRLAFEGVAILALIAAAGAAIYTWSHRPAAAGLIVGFVLLWLLGAVVTVLLHGAFERSR
jgi:hypothetical protein